MTSSRRPDQWIFPGGGVEPEEDASVTAVREVVEEAGVTGKLDRFLGIFEVRVSIVLFSSFSFYYFIFYTACFFLKFCKRIATGINFFIYLYVYTS